MAHTAAKRSRFDPALVTPALWESVRKLAPAQVAKNPVMFVVEAGSAVTTLLLARDIIAPGPGAAPIWFTVSVTLWLWFTVLFANFAEAVAEGRGKAEAATLRRMRKETTARRRVGRRDELVPASQLRKGDVVTVAAGELIPGDGEVIEGIASVDEARAHVLAGKGPYAAKGFEHAAHIERPDGDRYFLPRATPVYGIDGAVGGAAVVLQDVTRLHRVDKLRDDLVATVAHEFRTPVASLQMALHLCLESAAGPLNEKQLDLLFAARADCERLRSLVDELLDLARIQSGQIELHREPVRLAELVDDLVEAHQHLAQHANVHLEAAVPPELPAVSADRERLHLALSNLVTNAVRHSPAGSAVRIGVQRQNALVRFEVADEGPGVAEEHRHRIFDRSVRAPGSPPGGGLGLSLAREIVEAHGGQIGVSCPPHGGSVFWITIPVTAEAVA